MNDLLLKSLGHGSELIDRLVGGSPKLGSSGSSDRFDRTGLTVDAARKLEVLYRSEDMLFVEYDRPSHSFWRAQELSLFWRHRHVLESPVADFGCGDGSFASALFKSVDIGIDQDPDALALARQFNIYKELVESDERHIPLENQRAQTVMSNSVLEHVSDLPAVLAELSRITVAGGKLLLTVPVTRYRDHLTKYYGAAVSERINRESYHRNLLTESEWRTALNSAGFAVDLVVHYQPDWYTFWYRFHRLFGPRAFGRIIPNLDRKLWRGFRSRYLKAVRTSIETTTDGANIFVIAHRRG
jgi:SAM-dependent methyltransferase